MDNRFPIIKKSVHREGCRTNHFQQAQQWYGTDLEKFGTLLEAIQFPNCEDRILVFKDKYSDFETLSQELQGVIVGFTREAMTRGWRKLGRTPTRKYKGKQ